MVKEKAKETALEMNVSNSCFSTRWVYTFKMRNAITCKVVCSDTKGVPPFTVA